MHLEAAASFCKCARGERGNREGGEVGNAVKINRLLIVCFGIVQGGEVGGVGVDGSLGAEQPYCLGSAARAAEPAACRGATQMLGTERGRGPEVVVV